MAAEVVQPCHKLLKKCRCPKQWKCTDSVTLRARGRKDLIDTVVKNTDHNKSVRDQMKTLQPRQFIHIASGSSDAPQVVKSGQLKRLHESSAAWVKGFTPQHPLAVHDEERRAKRARSGAAGSSGP